MHLSCSRLLDQVFLCLLEQKEKCELDDGTIRRFRNWLNENNSLLSVYNIPGTGLGAFHTLIFLDWLL